MEKLSVIGEWRDIIKYADGRVVITDWQRNCVVKKLGVLVSEMLKGASESGISFWAIGSGNVSWDTTPFTPTISDADLTAEFARKAISAGNIVYINDSNEVSETPTNRLQISCMFESGDANGDWREFAIIAGTGASATVGTGKIINHKAHSLLVKTSDMTVTRQIRFTFVSA